MEEIPISYIISIEENTRITTEYVVYAFQIGYFILIGFLVYMFFRLVWFVIFKEIQNWI